MTDFVASDPCKQHQNIVHELKGERLLHTEICHVLISCKVSVHSL